MKKVYGLSVVILTLLLLLTACGAKPLALDQTALDMKVGDTAQLSAGDAVKVSWSSSDENIVTVDAGLVSAKAAGTAIVTAAVENGQTATCTVTVADKLITHITLSATSTRIEVGKTIQLSASYAPPDASKTALFWESADKNIAQVDEDGYVTGIAEGTTEITCKSENDVKATCTVAVGGKAEMPTTAATAPPAAQIPTIAPTESATNAESEEAPVTPSSGGMIFPDSSARYLAQSEVTVTLKGRSGSPVSESFAQDAINEIYARNGYIFRTESIRSYYEAQSWYHPNPGYDGSLNSFEAYNIALLSGY